MAVTLASSPSALSLSLRETRTSRISTVRIRSSSSSSSSALSLSLRKTRTSRISTVRIRSSSSSSSSASSSMDEKHEESSHSHRKRVVVCGGGVIGVCTAYFIAKKGASVTLIEKSSIACAASGKAAGFLALDWFDGGSLAKLARASFNLHHSLSEELDGAKLYGYRRLNTLSLSITEHKINPPPHPLSVKSISDSSSKSAVPSWIDGIAWNPKIIGTPETTAQVHPQLFTQTLLSTAVSNYGVEVVIGKLERVEVENGRVKSVLLEGDRVIEADSVVLALGPWSSKLPLLSSIFRVHGLKGHSIILTPKDTDAITPPALYLSYHPAQGGNPTDPGIYPRPTGEVYVCGMFAEEPIPNDPEQVRVNPESIQALKRVAANVSSSLSEGEANVKAEQACFLPCTDDSVPIIGKVPGVEGCYVATGHNGWGILNGPATGAAMAELVVDGHASIVDLSAFSPARFVSSSIF